MMMRVRPFTTADTEPVVALWEACGLTRPWNDPRRDIERKLMVQPELFLVGEFEGAIVASAMGGYDGHRGTAYYVGVHPAHQGRGFGASIIAVLEEKLLAIGCPKVNLLVRGGNEAAEAFYARLGYERHDSSSIGKRLIPD